jgi:hypothetical protein
MKKLITAILTVSVTQLFAQTTAIPVVTGMVDRDSQPYSDYSVDYNSLNSKWEVVHITHSSSNSYIYYSSGINITGFSTNPDYVYSSGSLAEPSFSSVSIEQGWCLIDGALYVEHIGKIDGSVQLDWLTSDYKFCGGIPYSLLHYYSYEPYALSEDPTNPQAVYTSGLWMDNDGFSDSIELWTSKIPDNLHAGLSCSNFTFNELDPRSISVLQNAPIYTAWPESFALKTAARLATTLEMRSNLYVTYESNLNQNILISNSLLADYTSRNHAAISTTSGFYIAYTEVLGGIKSLKAKRDLDSAPGLQQIVSVSQQGHPSYGYNQLNMTVTVGRNGGLPIIAWMSDNHQIWTYFDGSLLNHGNGHNPTIERGFTETGRDTYKLFYRTGTTLMAKDFSTR